jgi:seryl-tRNA synthetase
MMIVAFKRITLFGEENDTYSEHGAHKRGVISSAKTEEAMIEMIERIESLIERLKGHLRRSKSVSGEIKLDAADDFAEGQTRLIEEVILIMSRFAEEVSI